MAKNRTLNLKQHKRGFFGRREFLVIVCSIIITSVGIKAADNLRNGKNSEPEYFGPCPADMVQVIAPHGNFCIDKYEASAGQNCQFKNPNTQDETRRSLDTNDCAAASVQGAAAWSNISQNQASIACARAGKRLPTNQEWSLAAAGTPDKNDNWVNDDCNVSGNWTGGAGLTGSGMQCKSASGAFDMVGNVWEWVAGTVNEGVYENTKLPSQGFVKAVDDKGMPSATSETGDQNYYNDYASIKNTGIRAIARGGYWANKGEAGQYSTYIVYEPSFAGSSIGFRCVK
ncbi:MAG: SUMF1/EgtB/PvdO family nonheme iron enzyme [bacterium]